MRKGISEIIEKLPNQGEGEPEYIKWLSETELPLCDIECINDYYLCCKEHHDHAAIVSEIQKYANEPATRKVCLYAEKDIGDRLLGNDELKEKVLHKYVTEGEWWDALVYRLTLIEQISEKTTETILSAYKKYKEPIPRMLEELEESLYHRYRNRKPLKVKEQKELYSEILYGRRFLTNISHLCTAKSPLEQFLWNDLETRQEGSFLYKKWISRKVIEPFPVKDINKLYWGSNPPYPPKQAEQYNEMLYNELKDNADWEEILNGILWDYEEYYEEFGIRLPNHCSSDCGILVCKTDMMNDIFTKYSPAYQTIDQMVEKGVLSKPISYYDDYTMMVYNKPMVEQFLKVANVNFGLEVPLSTINLHKKNGVVFGTINTYLATWVNHIEDNDDEDNDDDEYEEFYEPVNEIKGEHLWLTLTFLVTKESRVYEGIPIKGNKYNRRWVPLQMKHLIPFMNTSPEIMDFFYTLADNSKTYFVKDVLNDIKEYGYKFKIPITYDEACKYHSRKDFFESKYKNAGILRWNYNKNNMGLSYMILKCINYVDIRDYGILQNTSINLSKYIEGKGCNKISKTLICSFLSGYYKERFKLTDEEMVNITDDDVGRERHSRLRACEYAAQDYISMCMEEHRPVVLHYSANRVNEEHDYFNNNGDYQYYLRNTKKFSVPKNSKFNELRKILPKQFEWVKTRKRLIDESMMMHHCVWSYYNAIARDDCAIYSYYDIKGDFDVSNKKEPKRYTIEFLYRKGKYVINQIQTKYDRGGGKLLGAEIEQILRNAD